MELTGKKVTVVGLARSGIGAANYLSRQGASVTVTDRKNEQELSGALQKLMPSIRCELGGHPEGIFTASDLVVVSPGVPLDIAPLADARSQGVPVIGELELAYQIINGSDSPFGHAVPFLAITGSNGKSTTTTLLDFILRKAGKRTLLGGNIGNALTEEILASMSRPASAGIPEYIVAEVSSFQLESISRFRPLISAILNITPDHMDRYHSLDEYSAAKTRIMMRQGRSDYAVVNADDPATMKFVRQQLNDMTEKPQVVYFSRTQKVQGLFADSGKIYCDLPDVSQDLQNRFLMSADEILIQGVHNLENAMAASAMALLAHCPVEAVIESLKEFKGLEHRLELVKVIHGVQYINDSKGTNVGAVVKSLESFHVPVILIAGGRDKAGEFAALRDLVKERVKTLVLIGEAADKIERALGDAAEIVRAADLRDAVAVSKKKAIAGDVVLLSPACASFDMFEDFEDRGRQFKKCVEEIAGDA